MLIERDADLNEYPESQASTARHICLGDLHGNTMKLIYFLVEEDVLLLKRADYFALLTIYTIDVRYLTAHDLNLFKGIIEGAGVNRDKSITLIGDELADRGENDYFTLLILKKLHHAQVNIEILLSNHGMSFLYYMKSKGENVLVDLSCSQSLVNLDYLLRESKLIQWDDIQNISTQCYWPMLRVFSYSVSASDELALYAHAPIGLETVEYFVEKINMFLDTNFIEYNDHTVESLMITIDRINEALLKLVPDELFRLYEQENETYSLNQDGPIPIQQPLMRLLWNRHADEELITTTYTNIPIQFVHGHIGRKPFTYNNKTLSNYLNLDSSWGKSPDTFKTNAKVKYSIRASDDRSSFDMSISKELKKEHKSEQLFTTHSIEESSFVPTSKLIKAHLIERQANIYQYPKSSLNNSTHVCLGDLHANAMKLIYFLIEEDILLLNEKNYFILLNIYKKNTRYLTQVDLFLFQSIVTHSEVNTKKSVVLMGSEVAGNGQNDYFTLLVLKKLAVSRVAIDILLSSQAMDFIDFFLQDPSSNLKEEHPELNSMRALNFLMKKKLIEETDVNKVVRRYYIPMLKLFSWSCSNKGLLTLYSHAPVGLEVCQQLIVFGRDLVLENEFADIRETLFSLLIYNDNTIQDLITTIEAINKFFAILIPMGVALSWYKEERRLIHSYLTPVDPIYPLLRLLRNEHVSSELVTQTSHTLPINFVHAHIEGEGLGLESHQNISSQWGKSPLHYTTNDTTKHIIRASNDVRFFTEEQPEEKVNNNSSYAKTTLFKSVNDLEAEDVSVAAHKTPNIF